MTDASSLPMRLRGVIAQTVANLFTPHLPSAKVCTVFDACILCFLSAGTGRDPVCGGAPWTACAFTHRFLEFYVLATSNVISGRVPTCDNCDNAHS